MAKKNISDSDLQNVAGGGQGTVDVDKVKKASDAPDSTSGQQGSGSGGNLMPADNADWDADGRN